MTVRSAGRSRERIVVFGPEGTGKSECAKDIAANIDGTLYVIDNDNAWDRMMEGLTIEEKEVGTRVEYRWVPGERGGGGWEEDTAYSDDTGNIVIYHCDGWEANVAAIEAVTGVATRDDWCCIDSGSALWDDVQKWFTESVFDSSMSDYFLQVRLAKKQAEKDAKALGAFDGWVDWPVINATYKDKVMRFLVNPPCHLIVTAEQAEVTKEDTDKETRTLYGSDVKARGQKRIGHNVQTVLRLRRENAGAHVVWTVKDRGGREKMVREDVTDRGFTNWYLREIAGWVDTEDSVAASPPTPPVVAVKKAAPVAKKAAVKTLSKGG